MKSKVRVQRLATDRTGPSPKIMGLIKEKGWDTLNELQLLSYEPIVKGYNVIITAPTGHGKTEAALIPILDKMIQKRPEPVALLYLTPMRALINDIVKRVNWWAQRLGLVVARKHGDVPQSEKVARLKKRPHILVSTPESLKIDLDWSSRFRESYRNLKWIVIDEVHEFVGNKRGAQLSLLLERLRKHYSIDPQIIALSATIGSPEKVLRYFTGSSKRPSEVVSVNTGKRFLVHIDRLEVTKNDFWPVLARRIVDEIQRLSIVFVPSRYMAERLLEEVEKIGVKNVAVHHSSISGSLKENIEQLMKQGRLDAVISTRTLELGIDISNVKKVIIVGSPNSATSLLQKIGRSGHTRDSMSEGTIISLSTMDAIESIAVAVNASRGMIEEVRALKCPLDVVVREALGIVLGGNELSPKVLSRLVLDSGVCDDFSVEQAEKLIEYLLEKKLLSMKNGRITVGPMFFKIWQFDKNNRRWWSRDFSEFFTVIGDSDSFQVRYNGKIIGELDSSFVYKYLRIGDTIRLSGQAWKVLEIDDNLGRIEVVRADSLLNEIPIWSGSTSVTSYQVVNTVLEILKNGAPSPFDANNITISERVVESLESAKNQLRDSGIRFEKDAIYVAQEHDNDRTIIISPNGQYINETLAAILLFHNTTRKTLNTSVKVSPYGIVVAPSVHLNEIIEKIEGKKEFVLLLKKAITRYPYYYSIVREIQHSLGVIGKVTEDDKMVSEEAIRQILNNFLDVEGAWELISSLKSGKTIIEQVDPEAIPSFLKEDLLRRPQVKAWVKDSTIVIAKTLQGWAFTEEEIAEIILLPPKTVEVKLKEMRKPDSNERVVRFMDVDLGEWRWVLLKDLEEIATYDEFKESFIPDDEEQSFLLQIRPSEKSPYISIITSAREVLENWAKIEKQIPTEEVYEMKVVPLIQGFMRNFAPRYYFVPKKTIPLLFINGVSMLQKLEGLE